MTYRVMAFYRFVPVEDLALHQAALRALAETSDICGTILIAPEGLNGTIASTDDGVDRALTYMDQHFSISKGEVKFSTATQIPFLRYKVRLKKEIVTLRQPQADPSKIVGTYVEPADWNQLMNDPEVLLLDTRNVYETKIGMFKGAVDPKINVFTEFPDFVKQHLDPKIHKKVAMFCTGGIRCEKASAYMLSEGFGEVYHLKGGILKYLEEVPAEESRWDGECFVFDRRVGVEQGLHEGGRKICHGCREPLTMEELNSEKYEEGVSCPHCLDKATPAILEGRRMRHRQMMRLVERESQKQHA